MPVPEKSASHCYKNPLDLVIENAARKDAPLNQADINRVYVAAQIQDGIERYRLRASIKSRDELLTEEHNSTILSIHLVEQHGFRPPRCHAHAIVAGKHKFAAPLRLIMAKLKIGIDDPDNGCWLPENTAATPHPSFPKAPPHSRIHRSNYFFWINTRLSIMRDELAFRSTLNLIGRMLHNGSYPDYVMLRKGAGLPGGVKHDL